MKKSAVANHTAVKSENSLLSQLPKSKFKKSAMPVSRRAYEGFVLRIFEVFDSDIAMGAVMINVLEAYLMGDASAADSLAPAMRMAWAFLKQDVDVAMERSRRARERAGARRRGATPQPVVAAPAVVAERRLSRRERRARERAALTGKGGARIVNGRLKGARQPLHNVVTATVAGRRDVEEEII